MENQLAEFSKASKSALCAFFETYGGAATRLVPYAYAGGPKVGTIATLAVALGNFAAQKNCNWDPNKEGPPAEGGWNNDGVCYRYENTVLIVVYCDEVLQGQWYSLGAITFKERRLVKGSYVWVYTGEVTNTLNGSVVLKEFFSAQDGPGTFRTESFPSGDSCAQGPGNDADPVEPLPPTHVYTTDEGCELNVDMKGLIQDNDGSLHGVWQIAPADETRASGSVISGCNFYPTIYYDGGGAGGGGGGTIPVPNPDPGGDWWKDKIGTALAGAAGNLTARAIAQLFEAKIPKAEFSFIAPCDKKEDGTPAEVIYQWDEQKYQDRVLSQQAVLMEMLQQHLNWKTPICYGNNQAGAYWRSITFESTTYSDDSNSRLVKRFRYRSNTPGDVRLLAQHWAGFSWNTGGVIVRHSGSALGSPKVWAASVDEGKRVIHHAGGEAGVDPDQVGEWSISSSNHPRYGVQRTVVLKQVDGCWMATARQGPDGWPEAASSFPDS